MGTEVQGYSVVGKSYPQLDALAKATGQARYAMEVKLPGMLYGKILRSPLPHARILNIDTAKARKVPGVKAVITGRETPGKKFGPVIRDQYLLATDKVRFVGEEVAAVAAIDEDAAEEAGALIQVDYEELPAVFDQELALAQGAPAIHEAGNLAEELHYQRGEPELGFRESDHTFEGRYRTHIQHQGHLEARSCVVAADPSGRITVWGGFQTIFRIRDLVATALDIPESKVRVVQTFTGGGFGGKTTSSKPPIAALLALKTARPIKMTNSWAEEFQAGRPRTPGIIEQKIGVKKDGTLVVRQIKAIVDCGAYAGTTPTCTLSMCVRAENLYRFQHLKGQGYTVYTNKTPTGACRGYGNPEGHFALETLLDEIAEGLHIDPLELRLKNAVEAGQTTLHGWEITSCGLKECLKEVAKKAGWPRGTGKKGNAHGLGLACAIQHSGLRLFSDFGGSSAFIKIEKDGAITLMTGESDMGQGAWTSLAQAAAEELGARFEDVQVAQPDTTVSPFCLGAYACRVMVSGGHAVRAAAADAKAQLLNAAAVLLEANPQDLVARESRIFVAGAPSRSVSFSQASQAAIFHKGGGPILGRGTYDPPTVLHDKETLYGNASPCYSFTAQVAEVEVDKETGEIKVLSYSVADDVGRVVNPLIAEGQVHGCISIGLGFALTEEIRWENGRVINPSFMDYRFPTAADLPSLSPVFVETIDPIGPFGAKSASEISVNPVAAAIANAVYDAVGVRIKDLPLTPEKVLEALKKKRSS